MALDRDVLDDHIDDDMRLSERAEDLRDHTRLIAQMAHRDLDGFFIGGDAGDDDGFKERFFACHYGALRVREARTHMDGDAVFHRQANRTDLEDLRAKR